MHLIDQGGDVPQLHEVRPKRPGRASPRSYSLEFKRRIVEETLAGRASVAAIARRNDMNTNTIWRWRREYLEGKLSGSLAPDAVREADFVPVRVTTEEPAAGSGLPAPVRQNAVRPAKPGGVVEITLPNRVRVRADAAVDEERLGRLLAMAGKLA